MIKRLKVSNLQKMLTKDFYFNNDINVLTGKNGSGKTTVLKLLWFLISGNIERIFPEMFFESIYFETDKFSINISHGKSNRNNYVTILFIDLLSKKETSFSGDYNALQSRGNIDDINRSVIKLTKSSIFFPTFRRIEGGFSLDQKLHYGQQIITNNILYNQNLAPLETALLQYSERLSVGDHIFVASISTNDVDQLIMREYAKASEILNKKYTEFSTKIIEDITHNKSIQSSDKIELLKNAMLTLSNIKKQAETMITFRTSTLKRYENLSSIIQRVFPNKSIKIEGPLVIGNSPQVIESRNLSAGEKQMLSFICYNAYKTNCPFFIDEPELSLHIDWQRELFDILIQQESNNQYFVATHSPMIYSKYSDKEIEL